MRNFFKKLTAGIAFALLFTSSVSAANVKSMLNKILFVEKEGTGITYLSVMDANGSNKKRLSPPLNNVIFPKYCEKSGWVAFTNQTKDMVSEIYLLNRNGDKLRKVLTNASFEDFSPDGKSFLYTSANDKAELYVYNLDSKKATKISQNLKVVSANWSTDGEWIIASVLEKDGFLDLYFISAYAQGIIKATNTPGINEAYPMFSKDNLNAVFYTNINGENEIQILGVGVKDNLALAKPGLIGTHPSFSPDGNSIVYQKGDDIMVGDIKGLKTKKIGTGKTPYWAK